MKKIIAVFVMFSIISCAELQSVIDSLPQEEGLSDQMIGNGLKQALDFGIDKQVTKLTAKDGFYKNALVKIAFPSEFSKVEKTLRDIGLGSLADEGVKILNRAAEDAVKQATPIFVDAVKQITFRDVKTILLGSDNAATQYLEQTTSEALYANFNPVIKNSFNKVGADQIWSNLITRYNTIPFIEKVNPDITDYVTDQALQGVYKMIAIEEKEIRTKTQNRTTDLLRRVFVLQD